MSRRPNADSVPSISGSAAAGSARSATKTAVGLPLDAAIASTVADGAAVPAWGACHQRDLAVEAEQIRHRCGAGVFARPASSPDPIAANSGCTLTTPYWRSICSVFAAIIHTKLIGLPGAATLGW